MSEKKKPKYEHDACDRCKFLGTDAAGSDWYVCRDKRRGKERDIIIKRDSSEPSDYASTGFANSIVDFEHYNTSVDVPLHIQAVAMGYRPQAAVLRKIGEQFVKKCFTSAAFKGSGIFDGDAAELLAAVEWARR